MKNIPLRFVVLALIVFVCSCNKKNNFSFETVSFTNPESADELYKAVNHINIIKLDSLVLIGSKPELIQGKRCYYIFEKRAAGKIVRFSTEGKFLNTIGNIGRGPTEFPDIKNVFLSNDTLFVISSPGITILKYLPDGTFISRKEYSINGSQAVKYGNGYLSYSGYGINDTSRIIHFENNGFVKEKFLKSDYKIINFSEETNVFYNAGDSLYSRETYCDTVYKYNGSGKPVPYLRVDFGKYKIPPDFFGFNDSFKAAQFLLQREFCIIRKYFESGKIKVIEGMINKTPVPLFFYGIKSNFLNNKNWMWISFGEINITPFVNSLYAVDDNKMIFLGDPSLVNNLSKIAKDKIANKDILNKITEESNYFIAEFVF